MTAAVVVTGIGVAAPNGIGAGPWWSAVLRGESGIRELTRFDASRYPVRIAGEITPFAEAAEVPGRLRNGTDRITRLTLAVADEALADAGLEPGMLPDDNAGVVTAGSAGGVECGQRELQALWAKGRRHVSVYHPIAWFPAAGAGQLSIRHRMHEGGGTIITEQAGGLDALATACRRLRKGATLMVSGGVDSALCPWGWAAHLADGRLSTLGDPARAYRPFDAGASGHVVGEGGALLVLEDETRARRRGVGWYGTVAGHAATFDADGAPQLRAAVEGALARAELAPQDIDVVFADAAGQRMQDREEARAIAAVFGPYGVPVTAPKTMTGRLSAGGAALDVVAALLSLRDQVVPPTLGSVRAADDCPVDLVTARPRHGVRLRAALVLARGRGGFNSAAVLRAAAPDNR